MVVLFYYIKEEKVIGCTKDREGWMSFICTHIPKLVAADGGGGGCALIMVMVTGVFAVVILLVYFLFAAIRH